MRFLATAAAILVALGAPIACGGGNGGSDAVVDDEPGDAGIVTAASPSFVVDIHPIFMGKCSGTGCHSEMPFSGSELGHAQPDVVAARADAVRGIDLIVARIEQGVMPPAGSPKVSTEELDLLRAWRSSGLNE
jgi:hypothetical protein